MYCSKNLVESQFTDETYDEYGSTDIITSTDTSYYDQNIPVTSINTDPEVCSKCESKVNRPGSFNDLDYFYYFKPQRTSGVNFRGNYGNLGNSQFYSNWMMGMNSNQGNRGNNQGNRGSNQGNRGNNQSNRGDFISMNGSGGGSRNSCNSRQCTQGQRTKNRIRNRRRNRQGNQQRFQQNNRINNMRSGNQNQNQNQMRSSKISTNCFDWLAW